MLGLGVPEIVIILVVLLLIFGPSRLLGLGKGIGEAIAEFRRGIASPGAGTKQDMK